MKTFEFDLRERQCKQNSLVINKNTPIFEGFRNINFPHWIKMLLLQLLKQLTLFDSKCHITNTRRIAPFLDK